MAASREGYCPGQPRSLTSVEDARQHVRPFEDGLTWTPYDATCCAPFPSTQDQMWVSTPNAWFVPSPPYQPKGERFGYFNDGMLGWHEHNKWPQRLYQPEQYSVASPCNPLLLKLHKDAVSGPNTLDESPLPFADPGIAWIHLVKSRDFYRATHGFSTTEGFIDRHLLDNMENATEEAKRLAELTAQRLAEPQTSDVPVHVRQVEADTALYQTSKAMQLNRACTVLRYHSMEWFDAVLWFREWQRLLLDLRAWILWLDVVRPRQLDPTFMKPFPVLPVRGVITSDPALVYDMFRVGVPVWYIHSISFLTTQTHILAVQSFVRPSIYFSDISTIEEDGATVSAPRLASGPRLRNMSYQDLRVYVRKFSLSHSPIYGLTDSVGLDIVRPHYDFGIHQVPLSGSGKTAPASFQDSSLTTTRYTPEQTSGVIDEHESEWVSGTEDYCSGKASVDELRQYYQPDAGDKLVETLPETDVDLDHVIESLTSALQHVDIQDKSSQSRGELRGEKVTKPPPWAHQSESLARLERFMLENFRDDNGKMQKYHLPPVHLFYAASVVSAPIVKKMHNWLRIRPWCFDQVIRIGEQGSTPMTAYEWKAALEGLYYSIPYDPSVVKPKSAPADIQRLASAPPQAKRQRTGPPGSSYKSKKNEKGQFRRLASTIDVNVRFGVHAGFDPYDADQQVTWGKTTLRSTDIAAQPGHTLLHEIIWELSVANFRLELLELDRAILRVVYDHPDHAVAARRESLVCRVWHNGHLRPTWESTNQCDALSSVLWADRISAVKQLAAILSAWPGGNQYKTWDPKAAWDAFAFFEFEYGVFLFYARAFHRRYGRRPILPLLFPKSLGARGL